MPDRAPPTPEFSRIFKVADVPRTGLDVTLTAGAAECAALARRFDLLGLENLSARGRLRPTAQGVRVALRVEALVHQACVVTLEPMASHLSDDLLCEFRRDLEDEAEISLEWGSEDPPEPLVNERVDLGDLVADVLGAMIDPYPRLAASAPEGEGAPAPVIGLAGGSHFRY